MAMLQAIEKQSGCIPNLMGTFAQSPALLISSSLAMEYAKQEIRVNFAAPGVGDTPLHKNNPKDLTRTLSPLARLRPPRTSPKRCSISPRRGRSPARCRTLTAARTWVGANPVTSSDIHGGNVREHNQR